MIFNRTYFFTTLIVAIFIFNLAPINAVDEEINARAASKNIVENAKKKTKKYNIIAYIAGDNNLYYFLWNNIKQMAKVGSNDQINIIVQINEPGPHKPTQRFFIDHNRAFLLNQEDVEAKKKLDSGNPETLSKFVIDALKEFPAEHNFLILSNHGSGWLDPAITQQINPTELFKINPNDFTFVLDRSFEYIDGIEQLYKRGICFDDSHQSYLTNEKLEHALEKICTSLGKKLDLIGMDACLMSMIEGGCTLKKYADIMISSQDVELGAGWDFEKILTPLTTREMKPDELARHVVDCYYNTYAPIVQDFTLAAVNLTKINKLELAIDEVARILQTVFSKKNEVALQQIVKNARAPHNCTCFEEPTYVDLGHWLKNMQNFLNVSTHNSHFSNHLLDAVNSALQGLQETVLAKTQGRNLPHTSGLSIYFPTRTIHRSYINLPFAKTNSWAGFLPMFINYSNSSLSQRIN